MKQEPRRITWSRTKTITELEAMIQEVLDDPDSKKGVVPGGIEIYNKKAQKRVDEMAWSIYYISKEQRKAAQLGV